MTLVHLDIKVNGAANGWQVKLVRDGADVAEHVMPKATGQGAQPAVAAGLPPAEVDAVLQRIRARTCQANDPVQLGAQLYAALLAPVWSNVDAELVAGIDRLELALDLHGARELAYLPWELMRGPSGYLARGIDRPNRVIEVAITRRNPRLTVEAPALRHPLRYLFVIGTALNDSVRAGAECLGLLRLIGDRIQQRIIQRPSLSELGTLVETFKPHVVHVISHGEIDPATGAASLRLYDDSIGSEVTVGGESLAERLVRNGVTPTMVVLSACASGAPLAAGDCEPLATSLVHAGVPIVIAMAGEIDDVACRLFTRSFGEALAQDRPPVWAAMTGRRAALRSAELPADAVDWAMIEVFLGDDVASDVAVAPASQNPDAALIDGWLKRSDVDLLPSFNGKRSAAPFCGRLDIVEAFYQLMAERRPPVLCITARPPNNEPQSQLGKRRTLIELAATATRDGHIPVPLLLHRKHPDGYPRDEAELLRRLAGAIRRTRTAYGLASRDGKLVGTLTATDQDAWREALTADLIALRDDARQTHALIAARPGNVVVLLNDVQEYGTAAPYLLQTLLTNFGLGAPNQVVPVVVTFRYGSAHDDTLLDTTEGEKRRSCFGQPMRLDPFGPGEDMLAYQRVLLQPYRNAPDAATKRWFLELRRRPKLVARVQEWFAKGTQGYPGKLWSDGFRVALEAATPDEANGIPGIVRAASDDDLLALIGGRP
jgi:CHAT domain-containing protein